MNKIHLLETTHVHKINKSYTLNKWKEFTCAADLLALMVLGFFWLVFVIKLVHPVVLFLYLVQVLDWGKEINPKKKKKIS